MRVKWVLLGLSVPFWSAFEVHAGLSDELISQNLPTQPDRDRFLQPAPSPPSSVLEERPVIPIPPPSPPEPLPTPLESTVPIFVRQIEVTGSTILEPEDIAAIVSPLEGEEVTLQELKEVTDVITQLYLDEGYLTSRAILEPQSITNGIVRIRVIEGGIEQINVEGTERLNPSYIRSRINLGVDTPLNVRKLENQLRLLLADPLLENVEPRLQAGTREGQSILMVRVTEAGPLAGSFSVDNTSPPSIGSERLGANVLYRSPTGLGDTIAASYYRSTTGGSSIWDLAYRIPINPMDGSLQLSTQINRNEITQPPFDAFGIEGESERYEISYRQPLVRSPQEELALSLGFSLQDGQTFVFDQPTPFGIGPDEEGNSRTRVIRFGQDYFRRDTGGAWVVRSQFNFGTDWFDATTNADSVPDGRFFSWLGQAQRIYRLTSNQVLILQLDLQLTPDSLLPSEQFVIGGGQSVRGYRQNVRSGDNGVRFSIEDRIALARNEAGAPSFQMAPFMDLGAVWNHPDNPNQLLDQQFLIATGLGALWEPLPNLNIRLDYGIPLVELDDRGENAQDEGFYFTVNYRF